MEKQLFLKFIFGNFLSYGGGLNTDLRHIPTIGERAMHRSNFQPRKVKKFHGKKMKYTR